MNRKELNAQKKEKGYIIGRQASLIMLALGTSIAMFRLGGYIGDEAFPESNLVIFIIRLLLVGLGFFGVDFIAQNALSSASDITSQPDVVLKDKNGSTIHTVNEDLAKRILNFGVLALVATILISTFSNYFVSSDLIGSSKLGLINDRIDLLTRQDSITKLKAFELIENAGAEESSRVNEAIEAAQDSLKVAIDSGSAHWQEDYRKHKDNPEAWFWVCTKCAKEYQAYRKRILRAIEQGNKKILSARGYSEDVRSSLSPTLSYSLTNDTTLHIYSQNIMAIENERKARGSTLFWLMTVFTIICGIISYAITIMLRDHRLHFGQFILEDHVTPIEQAIDMLIKVVVAIRDLFYTILSAPYKYMKDNNWIRAYELEVSGGALTVNQGRVCKNDNCGNSIEHKSRNAKFCSDDCRNEWHNNSRA